MLKFDSILRLALVVVLAAGVFLMMIASSSVVDAQASWTCNSAASSCIVDTSRNSRCDFAWLKTQLATRQQQVYTTYLQCRDNGDTCCNDPCINFQSSGDCLKPTESADTAAPLCVFMAGTVDQASAIGRFQCLSKVKLCALSGNATCSVTPLCEWDASNNQCNLKLSYSPQEQAAGSISNCPALHPAVVAFLVLMFISLVGAIIFVVVVVIVKQRKADEEEKKAAEEAAAAEAAAKAQQEEQADF
jgi:hypothetical protein